MITIIEKKFDTTFV